MPAEQPADPFRRLCDLCFEQSWHLFVTPYKDGTLFVSVYSDEMELSDEPLVALWEPLPAQEAYETLLERAHKRLEEFREWAGDDVNETADSTADQQ